MNDPRQILFDRVMQSSALAERVARVAAGKKVAFEHVTPAAQPFLVALLATRLRSSETRVWVMCGTERAQEQFHADLTNWLPEAMIFPHLEVAAVEGALPDPETSAERLAVAQRLAEHAGGVVVLNQESFDEAAPAPKEVRASNLRLEPGLRLDRDDLIARLVAAGYETTPQVVDRGQFSVRGGVMDIYSWQQVLPVRVEWFDDEIESIREFELDQQTSIRALGVCNVLFSPPKPSGHTLRNYRKKADVLIAVEMLEAESAVHIGVDGTLDSTQALEDFEAAFFPSPLHLDDRAVQSPALHEAAQRQIKKQMWQWQEERFLLGIQSRKISDQSAAQKFLEIFTFPSDLTVHFESSAPIGFLFPAAKLAVTSGVELLGYNANLQNRAGTGGRNRRGLLKQRSQIDFTELTEGDLVVHLEYGIARFRGLQVQRQPRADPAQLEEHADEMMVLEFAEQARLYVPLDQAFLVSRYVGIGKRGTSLSGLGDSKWSSAKKSAEKSIYDYAAKLLKVQAARETNSGFEFAPDNSWQKEFEDAFPYRETADQIKAIQDTKEDMETGRPMDRLICGDVGFGKTEVAIRAAFKAAVNGRQVAMLVPTTVLAQQHYESFAARMANYPVNVELLSRYRSRAEQNRVAEGIREGSVDIVIGTHRLISKDVEFKSLGLLVVDEEQRFGVRHKERIKEKFPHVDVLTLSATPIPRTLYMALTGARDLSTLETPPPNRYPVETNICAYDERVIRAAVDRELDRQGQVYFLHNRVEDIERVSARVRQLCPRARVDIGHGQMEEGQLEGGDAPLRGR